MRTDCTVLHYSLQLCDSTSSTSYGSVRCGNYAGGCKGAATGIKWADNCYPDSIWGGTYSSGKYWSGYNSASQNEFIIQTIPRLNAVSVRCAYGCKMQHTARAPP